MQGIAEFNPEVSGLKNNKGQRLKGVMKVFGV